MASAIAVERITVKVIILASFLFLGHVMCLFVCCYPFLNVPLLLPKIFFPYLIPTYRFILNFCFDAAKLRLVWSMVINFFAKKHYFCGFLDLNQVLCTHTHVYKYVFGVFCLIIGRL